MRACARELASYRNAAHTSLTFGKREKRKIIYMYDTSLIFIANHKRRFRRPDMCDINYFPNDTFRPRYDVHNARAP